MLLAEFDLPTMLTNFGGMGVAVWMLYGIQRSQLKAFENQMALERTRADEAIVEDRRRSDELAVTQRNMFVSLIDQDRKQWLAADRRHVAAMTDLAKVVREHMDNCGSNGQPN